MSISFLEPRCAFLCYSDISESYLFCHRGLPYQMKMKSLTNHELNIYALFYCIVCKIKLMIKVEMASRSLK